MTHEFEGESYPETIGGPTIAEELTGAEWDGWPLKYMTVDNLLAHEGVVNYVWPYEGHWNERGTKRKWKFHGGKVMDGETEVDCPKTPLMIDASSARAFKLVWEAINDKNKEKTRGFLASRGLTVWAFEKLIWPNVRFGG